MIEEPWRPLGVESEDAVAEYDALHDGVPAWMNTVFWDWIQSAVTTRASREMDYEVRRFSKLDSTLVEQLCQTLQIPLPNVRGDQSWPSGASDVVHAGLTALRKHPSPLQIADYLLAHNGHANSPDLEALLVRSKSAWTVGVRSGKPGLVRRVPRGVQVAADSVMARSGRAGVRLAKAWEELYGLAPNPSEAYRLAILAVEDAAIPLVSPAHSGATLGTVLKQIEDQKDWRLPLAREHKDAPSGSVIVGMLRMLWHGHHDRHGGQPAGPGDVSLEEAKVAVAIAVTLVDLFEAGLISRLSKS